jgi:hypothetical protein
MFAPTTLTGLVIAVVLMIVTTQVTLLHRADKHAKIKDLADTYGVDEAIRLSREIDASTVKVVREITGKKGEPPKDQPR